MGILEKARIGAAHGLAVWAVFAAVEFAFCTLRPILGGVHDVVQPSYWSLSGLLLIAYLIVGAFLGALTGFLGTPLRKEAATLTLVSVFIINLAVEFRGWEFPQYLALGVALVMFAFLAGAVWLSKSTKAASMSADPWLAAMLLLGVPWVADSPNIRNAVAFLVALLLTGVVSRRYLSSQHQPSAMPVRQLAAAAVAIAAVLTVTATVSRDLPPLTARKSDATAGGSPRPNIVLVVLDTVRADHMSLYGYSRETTPGLSRFAAGATVYPRAMASCNWTLPTHASLFTGLYARAHGAINYSQGNAASDSAYRGLAPKFVTLAEQLTAAGYLSVAEVANIGFVRPTYGLGQGFSYFDVRELAPWLPPRELHYPRRLMRSLMVPLLDTLEFDRVTRPAEAITTDAIRLIEQASGRTQPFFAFLNYMDAHDPYLPRAPFDSTFSGKDRRMTRSRYLAMARDVISLRHPMTEEDRAHCLSQYDGAIRYMDSEISRLIERLRQLKVYDNTVIVITSDHGEAFGENNFVNHRQSLYQDQLTIPMIIKYAGQQQPRTDSRLASPVDVMPTILEAAGLPIPQGLHGQSLFSTGTDGNRPIFAEAYADLILARLRPGHPARQFAIYLDHHKLIYNSNGKNELFDLVQDPTGKRNLYSSDALLAKTLEAGLNNWLDSVPLAIQPKTEMDTRTLNRLKALGYVQ